MSAPLQRSGWERYREPTYVFLMIGVLLTSFGFGMVCGGRHLAVAVPIMVVGLCLLVPMRVVRSRSGRRP
jgi:hypothetical protein